MSYQPPPEPITEFPKLFEWKHRLLAFKAERPGAFWFRVWLYFALFSMFTLATSGLTSFTGLGGWLYLMIAAFGWAYPFILWIKANRHP